MRGDWIAWKCSFGNFPREKRHWIYPWMGWETLPIPLLSTGKASNNRDWIPEKGGKRSRFPKNPGSLRSALGTNPGNVGTTGWVRSSVPKFPFSPWKFQHSFGISSLTLSPSAWKSGMQGLELLPSGFIPTVFTHYPGKGIPGELRWDIPTGKLFQDRIPGNPGRSIPVGILSFHVESWN